jgi:prepilin-type N-terminal cleavage/methylation domain-containing protein
MHGQLSRRTRRRGFTLTELVIVLVILAAVAALVIPRLGFIKSQADNATAAAGAAQVASNLETYYSSTGQYPLRLDSLLVGTGGTTAPTGVIPMFYVPPGSVGLPSWLTMENLDTTSTYRTSLAYAGLGSQIMDHDETRAPNESAVNLRTMSGSGTSHVATVVVPATPSDTNTGTRIARAAGYGTGVLPADVKLVAMGIGTANGAIGTTMASAPAHSGQDSKRYGRFIAIFAVYANSSTGSSSKPAQLRTVVDSNGTPISTNVTNYKNNAPTRE